VISDQVNSDQKKKRVEARNNLNLMKWTLSINERRSLYFSALSTGIAKASV